MLLFVSLILLWVLPLIILSSVMVAGDSANATAAETTACYSTS